MARGRYAAKAANRIANLDNEVLQEKVAEIATLKSQLRALAAELALERKQRGALVLKRANELSEETVRAARQEVADIESARHDTLRMIADYLVVLFKTSKKGEEVSYPNGFFDLLPILITDTKERSAFIDNLWNTTKNGEITQ